MCQGNNLGSTRAQDTEETAREKSVGLGNRVSNETGGRAVVTAGSDGIRKKERVQEHWREQSPQLHKTCLPVPKRSVKALKVS